MTQIDKSIDLATKKEISATARWGFGILIALFCQTCGLIWWQSSWQATTSAQLNQNTKDIQNLKSGTAVILTRDQLNDILNSRDIRLDNIDRRLGSIEDKLDKVVQ